MRNPFIVGQPVPPEQFVGRESQIETAFDQIYHRGNLAIWGGPGMGKTSFLEVLTSPEVWQLQGHNSDNAIMVLVGCLSIYPFTSNRFWRTVLEKTRSKLDSALVSQMGIHELIEKDPVTSSDLQQLLHKLGQADKFLVLLVDDYDVALRPNSSYEDADIESFLSECRSLSYFAEERKYLSVIVTSSRRLNDLGPRLTPDKSPWYNHYLFQPLKPFTDREFSDLLAGIPMTSNLRAGIREIADGNPALLQNAGYLLYKELRARKVPDPNEFVRDFYSATEQFFQDTWDLCDELEQVLLMLIALQQLEGRLSGEHYTLSGINTILSQKEFELNTLEMRGLIQRTAEQGQGRYSFSSSLMEWWVVKTIQNTDEEELQSRQKVFLNLMSHQQAEKIKSAIRWVWVHKDQLPSILKWIGKVVAALPKGAIE